MAVQFGPRLKAFLDEPMPITLGTTRHDGSVELTPVWFEYRDGQIWLNGGPKRDWFKHMKRDPRVSLQVVDPQNMFRWAAIEGTLADTDMASGDDHIEHLSQRYTGAPYRNPKVDRMVVRINPTRVRGWESGQPWDVTS